MLVLCLLEDHHFALCGVLVDLLILQNISRLNSPIGLSRPLNRYLDDVAVVAAILLASSANR